MEPNYWVVKAKPSTNDLSYLRRGLETSWYTRKPSRIAPGDRVFIWAASPTLRIEALAVVSRSAVKRGEFFVFKLRHLTSVLANPVTRDECWVLPKVKDASFFKPGPMGTIAKLTPAQAKVLFARLSSRNRGLDRVWPDLPRRGRGGVARRALALVKPPSLAGDLADVAKLMREPVKVGRTTSRQLVLARLGQGRFRAKQLRFWGACAVTGCRIREALKASHIKPWRLASNAERLSVSNGLLLVATLDSLFDAGLVSFSPKGALLVSPRLGKRMMAQVGIAPGMRLRRVPLGHKPFLAWHRRRMFKSK